MVTEVGNLVEMHLIVNSNDGRLLQSCVIAPHKEDLPAQEIGQREPEVMKQLAQAAGRRLLSVGASPSPHGATRRRRCRSPSVTISDLRGHFFTAK
jgi:hypothetical protein